MNATIDPIETEVEDVPEWGEWWPEALEQRELDNADADCSPQS